MQKRRGLAFGTKRGSCGSESNVITQSDNINLCCCTLLTYKYRPPSRPFYLNSSSEKPTSHVATVSVLQPGDNPGLNSSCTMTTENPRNHFVGIERRGSPRHFFSPDTPYQYPQDVQLAFPASDKCSSDHDHQHRSGRDKCHANRGQDLRISRTRTAGNASRKMQADFGSTQIGSLVPRSRRRISHTTRV